MSEEKQPGAVYEEQPDGTFLDVTEDATDPTENWPEWQRDIARSLGHQWVV